MLFLSLTCQVGYYRRHSHFTHEVRSIQLHLANLEKAEVQLNKFYSIAERIDQCTPDEKRLAFEGLGMEVKATPELIEISVVPVDITPTQLSEALLTIEQTSALLLTQTNPLPTFQSQIYPNRSDVI